MMRRCALSLYCLPLLGLLFGNCVLAQSGWHWQHPLPQGNTLSDVAFASSSTGVAVGDYGTILRSTDGGVTWLNIGSPTRFDLKGVAFADAMHGIAVGQYGTKLQSSDGGAHWTLLPQGYPGSLTAVTFADPSTRIRIAAPAGRRLIDIVGAHVLGARC